MINIHDGQITDLLSNSLRYNPETISIGYAILQEKRRILYLAERTLLMAAVEILDEKALDYLAVELRTPAYDDSFPIETKRTLIKGTLPYYEKLGTPAAVDWVIKAIFGNGYIQEWFEYGGRPHYFRVNVDVGDQVVQSESLTKFQRIVENVKRLSSWMDEIILTKQKIEASICVGGVFGTQMTLPIPEAPDGMKWLDTLRAGGMMALISVLPVPERT